MPTAWELKDYLSPEFKWDVRNFGRTNKLDSCTRVNPDFLWGLNSPKLAIMDERKS